MTPEDEFSVRRRRASAGRIGRAGLMIVTRCAPAAAAACGGVATTCLDASRRSGGAVWPQSPDACRAVDAAAGAYAASVNNHGRRCYGFNSREAHHNGRRRLRRTPCERRKLWAVKPGQSRLRELVTGGAERGHAPPAAVISARLRAGINGWPPMLRPGLLAPLYGGGERKRAEGIITHAREVGQGCCDAGQRRRAMPRRHSTALPLVDRT